jgi:hypothetical protein
MRANFYEAGKDRLVMPGFKSENSQVSPTGELGGENGGDGEPPNSAQHPYIEVLLNALPEPGTAWPQGARVKWVQALNKAFDTIYKTGD